MTTYLERNFSKENQRGSATYLKYIWDLKDQGFAWFDYDEEYRRERVSEEVKTPWAFTRQHLFNMLLLEKVNKLKVQTSSSNHQGASQSQSNSSGKSQNHTVSLTTIKDVTVRLWDAVTYMFVQTVRWPLMRPTHASQNWMVNKIHFDSLSTHMYNNGWACHFQPNKQDQPSRTINHSTHMEDFKTLTCHGLVNSHHNTDINKHSISPQ